MANMEGWMDVEFTVEGASAIQLRILARSRIRELAGEEGLKASRIFRFTVSPQLIRQDGSVSMWTADCSYRVPLEGGNV